MANANNRPAVGVQQDLVRPSLSGFVLWCVPICVGTTAALLHLRPVVVALTWAGSFVWMSTGCFINVRRCRRLHCYISGPAFFLGALAAALAAFGGLPFGPRTLNYVVSATFAAALLSFVPELVWRKYV